MKKFTKPKTIKKLAEQFEEDLNKTLPVTVRQDGSIVFKNYYIKQNKMGNWVVYHLNTRELIDQFFLKSCALMAAKAYDRVDIVKYRRIKTLDNKYWANYSDTLIFERNIKTVKDFERYCILLTRLEQSRDLSKHFRDEISRMFKWSFV